MANVVVITTPNLFIVDFGVFAPLVGYKKATFQKGSISFQLVNDETFVRVEDSRGGNWSVSYNLSGQALIIDSVDGVAPTSNEDLFNILSSKI